ncbi:MAG: hypothetical protein IKT26_06625, partial [Bacteroidaceae bacterium]|nr:hypothetical protein [Bacteroidaceae bacterium]
LSGIVKDLTNITPEELEEGTTFSDMMRRFSRWIGKEPTTVLTWSNTDLLVLMENCRFFNGRQEIPFLQNYMDFQVYAQQRMGVDTSQQLGLARAGEMLGIPEELYTPLFAIARIAGWCAHRIEEVYTGGRIIRPAYRCVADENEYVAIDQR